MASSREPNSAYHIGGLPRGVFSCSRRIGTTGLKNYNNQDDIIFVENNGSEYKTRDVLFQYLIGFYSSLTETNKIVYSVL